MIVNLNVQGRVEVSPHLLFDQAVHGSGPRTTGALGRGGLGAKSVLGTTAGLRGGGWFSTWPCGGICTMPYIGANSVCPIVYWSSAMLAACVLTNPMVGDADVRLTELKGTVPMVIGNVATILEVYKWQHQCNTQHILTND